MVRYLARYEVGSCLLGQSQIRIRVNGGGSGLCLAHGSASLCHVSHCVRVEEKGWSGYRDKHAVANSNIEDLHCVLVHYTAAIQFPIPVFK